MQSAAARRAPECRRTAAAWTPPVAALAAQAGTFSALPCTTALPQAVAAADGRLGRAEQDLAAKVALGTLLGLRLMVTDLAAQLGATGRHRSSAQTPDRWAVVAKMLPQR
jgi:hypothetical protein